MEVQQLHASAALNAELRSVAQLQAASIAAQQVELLNAAASCCSSKSLDICLNSYNTRATL